MTKEEILRCQSGDLLWCSDMTFITSQRITQNDLNNLMRFNQGDWYKHWHTSKFEALIYHKLNFRFDGIKS